tara:strand:+ start:9878 stop:11977 length:2100 start_codon:yes stop_codon:yes gene_type:complete
MNWAGSALVLNDLKEYERTAPIMGKRVLCIVAILMLLPITTSANSQTIMTTDGVAWVDCEDSWANIQDPQGNDVANGSDFTVNLQAGNHTIFVDNTSKCQTVIPVTEELPNLRPAPADTFDAIDTTICSQPYLDSNCQGTYISGDLIDDDFDIFTIDVDENQIFVLNLLAASSAIDIDLHFQNSSSEKILNQSLSLPLNTSINGVYQIMVPIDESGRVIVTIHSPNPNTIWAVYTEIYSTGDATVISNLANFSGIGSPTIAVEIGGDESLVVSNSESSVGEDIGVKYRYVYTATSISEWSNASTGDRIYGVADIEHIEFKWDCNCEWMASMERYTHYDANWGMDAPGFKPLTASSNNSSYPLIVMDGHTEEGELTLQMGDYQDILRVETTGWNESVHLVDVIVEGDIYDIRVTIWNMDQETWDILDESTATYSMDRITLSLDVGLGTHFIQIQHINGSDSLNGDGESLDWRIRVSTAVLDEGDEPWFPPSDAVKEAADVFYWIMGLILILPFIIFYINVKKTKAFAEEFARKKNRLQWLSTKLDDGSFSPSDLSRALRSVSTLEWEEALEVWGQEEVRHFTTGIDLAVWTLDHRLSEDGSWPLLIGLRPQDCEWSVAALKFESPEGEPWTVSRVEPKLLSRAHEVFLDTIHDNTRVFIRVDLQGSAESLDIHLSGMVNSKPMAAKPASTIYRNLSDSEE